MLKGGPGTDWLEDELGQNSLVGDSGDDVLYGGVHADQLDGGPGWDELFGEAGDDVLLGGLGTGRLLEGTSSSPATRSLTCSMAAPASMSHGSTAARSTRR